MRDALQMPPNGALLTLPQHCPGCDYALEGLPNEGICPECGGAYDDRFLVLRGRAVGWNASTETAGPIRAVFLAIAGLAYFWQTFFSLPTDLAIGNVGGVVSGVLTLAFVVVLLTRRLRRRFAIAGPPAQLWLGPCGYRLRGRCETHFADSERGAALLRVFLWGVGIGSVVATLSLLHFRLGPWASTTFCVAAIFITIAVAYERRLPRIRTQRIAIAGLANPMIFASWNDVTTVRVVPRRDAYAEVRIEPVPSPFLRNIFYRPPPVRLIVELNRLQIESVELTIARFRNAMDSNP